MEKVDLDGNDCFDKIVDIEDFTLVIFGGAGDLSRKKLLPTLYDLFVRKQITGNFTIIGSGSSLPPDNNKYREIAKDSILADNTSIFNENTFQDFSKHLFFTGKRLEEDITYEILKQFVIKNSSKDTSQLINILFYMAVPPALFETIINKIKIFEMNTGIFKPKIIIEKPFGYDLASSNELNRVLSLVFTENQIYRIDHYLGKETLQNIIFFRFSNSIFEPLWNRSYIDNVQITVAEDIGIEERGKFYEKAGVVRDIVQNHVMQIIALIAMEPPVDFDADLIRDEKVKVFRSISIMTPEMVKNNTIRGQYGKGLIKGEKVKAYNEEIFVAQNSKTATFFAGKFEINNWRWAGVPFYVRAGKRLSKRITEIVIQFKQPPLHLFGNNCQNLEPSLLTLCIYPEESITLKFGVKYPNTTKKVNPVKMRFSYADEFNIKPHPPYSRLILDCLKGDLSLFVRQDGEEAMWKIIDEITKEWEKCDCPEFPNYPAGTEGPKLSNLLLEKDGRKWITKLK